MKSKGKGFTTEDTEEIKNKKQKKVRAKAGARAGARARAAADEERSPLRHGDAEKNRVGKTRARAKALFFSSLRSLR